MKIAANIIKCVDNAKFVSKKSSEYYELAICTKRIWLSEELNVTPSKNNVYEITTKAGRKIEGNIVQCDRDEIGFFIVFHMIQWSLATREPELWEKRIPRRPINIRQVFAQENIEGANDIINLFNGYWPSFHGAHIEVERRENNIMLTLSGRCLGEIGITIALMKITDECYSGEHCDSLNCFKDGRINEVNIRTTEKGTYKLFINNSYIEEIPSQEEDVLTVIEHTAEAVIECEVINLNNYNAFYKALQEKDIKYAKLFSEDVEHCLQAENLRKKWFTTFAKDVDVSEIYIDSYLWHLFSYEKVKAIEGEQASD